MRRQQEEERDEKPERKRKFQPEAIDLARLLQRLHGRVRRL